MEKDKKVTALAYNRGTRNQPSGVSDVHRGSEKR